MLKRILLEGKSSSYLDRSALSGKQAQLWRSPLIYRCAYGARLINQITGKSNTAPIGSICCPKNETYGSKPLPSRRIATLAEPSVSNDWNECQKIQIRSEIVSSLVAVSRIASRITQWL